MSDLQYNCDSCRLGIVPTNPRIHCLVCADYDLCANCAIAERFTQGHQAGHQASVFKQSGGGGQHPVPSANTIVYATPPLPPARSPPPPGYQANSRGPPPPLPPRLPSSLTASRPGPASPPPTTPAASNNANASTGWQPFFYPDSAPTPFFVQIINDIFTYLDPSNTGNLLPETFSRFLDDMGFQTHENSWKQGLIATFNASKETMADKSLKIVYDLFSIEHVLLQRVQAPHVDPTGVTSLVQGVLGVAYNPSMTSVSQPGPMPCITRNGLVELCRINMLSDPSKQWGNFSRMLRKYNLPQYIGWGDLPRSVLPDVPDAAMLQRVAGISEFSKHKANEILDAARAAAMIRAKGRQNGLDLISNTRYRYY
ncbi:hypothetical protein BDN70DRAFT_871837 [Pholiota conissans]|uniref:ZZ-type domain-containing protein n=1 Tax=Pholiota conissans TaxID=109636 RepID=A0A9P6CZ65_9AGAR|nr:hypothetical protein BDN70DRAFT_871837 [Pholiota conissans]